MINKYERDKRLKGNLSLKLVGIEPLQISGFDVVSSIPKYIKCEYEVDLIKGNIEYNFRVHSEQEILPKTSKIDSISNILNKIIHMKLDIEEEYKKHKEDSQYTKYILIIRELQKEIEKENQSLNNFLEDNSLEMLIEYGTKHSNTYRIMEVLK
jgi:hypothetical protein